MIQGIILGWLALGAVQTAAPAEPPKAEPTACHLFIDHQYIWTVEVLKDSAGKPAPILNIITFLEGQWDLRPPDIHLFNPNDVEAEIEKFAIDTGVPGDPYIVRYLKVHGDSFIGIDLMGDFEGFEKLSRVSIDLGETRFLLEPIDCLDFENTARQIDQINYDSPDIRQDFEVLGISYKGKREARRRYF